MRYILTFIRYILDRHMCVPFCGYLNTPLVLAIRVHPRFWGTLSLGIRVQILGYTFLGVRIELCLQS